MLLRELCPSRAPSTALLGGLHVGRYGAPGCQALKALVCVINEDPVFALVVRLRVVTCGHWQRNRRETESLPYLNDNSAPTQHPEEHSTDSV